ncbi:MAG: hypothetical protein ACTSVZ_09455, partial [Promethearchaeota archaeon]
MKLYYAYPTIFESDPTEMGKKLNSHSIGMIAITPAKDLVVVEEMFHPSIWESFWAQVAQGKPLNLISIKKSTSEEDPNNITSIRNHITDGLNYIMGKGYIFIGLLYSDSQPFDKQIIEEKGLFKVRKSKEFLRMLEKYHEKAHYPLLENKQYVKTRFLGVGEDFFSLSSVPYKDIAQMSSFFRGNLNGIMGMPQNEDLLQFVILSQNITKEQETPEFILNKHGRKTLINLIKTGEFSSVGGFRLDYGLDSIRHVPQWGSLELIPQFNKLIQTYQKYLQALILGQKIATSSLYKSSPFDKETEQLPTQNTITPPSPPTVSNTTIIPPPRPTSISPSEIKAPLIEEINSQISPEKVSLPKTNVAEKATPQPLEKISLAPMKPKIDELEKPAIIPLVKPSITPATTPLEKPSITPPSITLEKPSIAPPSITLEKPSIAPPSITLAKPTLEPIKPQGFSSGQTSIETEEYEDVFQRSEEIQPLFDDAGKKQVLDTNELSTMIKDATLYLEGDLGHSVDPILMSQNDILKDMEASLAALSQLDEISQNEQAESRIYYPPAPFISTATKEGMQIGGSICVLSMGAGRNIWMVPEVSSQQMWGEFWSQEEVEGNPQVKEFSILNSKEIEEKGELEDLLQNAFITIRRNNHIFLGLICLEGNGFETTVYAENDLSSSEIAKLNENYMGRRDTAKFPEIAKEHWISMQYYGREEAISFLMNPNATGALEIATNSIQDRRFQKGIVCGIICVDEVAGHFFMLSDNLNELDSDSPAFQTQQETLDKMFYMIESSGLTPVSWCKMIFGYQSLDEIPFFDEI